MSVTLSPNMSLPIPGVGTEPGPEYATYVNNSLTLVDAHDHTPGKGNLITPSAIDINTSFSMNGNFVTQIAGLTLAAQVSTPANATIYRISDDLYYVDGLGNAIRLTQSGAVAGTPGSIANLVSPASATYVSIANTFVWQSDTLIAADMDFGSAIMRNISPNSTFALTLSPPTLTSDYTITLPILPASKKIVTLDASGTMAADYDVDNSTIVVSSNLIQVPTSGIDNINIAPNAVTYDKIASSTIRLSNIDLTDVSIGGMTRKQEYTSGSGNFVVPAGITQLLVLAQGGGGGGGGGTLVNGGPGGGGGSAGFYTFLPMTVTPGASIPYVVGAAGAGGPQGNAGSNGSNGGDTYFNSRKLGLGGVGGIGGFSGGAGGVGYLSVGNGGNGGAGAGTNGGASWAGVIDGGAGNLATPGSGGGGSSIFAQGGTGGGASGGVGTGYGAGGGGSGATVAGVSGGAGGSGYIAIYY